MRMRMRISDTSLLSISHSTIHRLQFIYYLFVVHSHQVKFAPSSWPSPKFSVECGCGCGCGCVIYYNCGCGCGCGCSIYQNCGCGCGCGCEKICGCSADADADIRYISTPDIHPSLSHFIQTLHIITTILYSFGCNVNAIRWELRQLNLSFTAPTTTMFT